MFLYPIAVALSLALNTSSGAAYQDATLAAKMKYLLRKEEEDAKSTF